MAWALGFRKQQGTLEHSIPKMGSVARKIRLSEQAFCNLRTCLEFRP
jgi:hypothetical protein